LGLVGSRLIEIFFSPVSRASPIIGDGAIILVQIASVDQTRAIGNRANLGRIVVRLAKFPARGVLSKRCTGRQARNDQDGYKGKRVAADDRARFHEPSEPKAIDRFNLWMYVRSSNSRRRSVFLLHPNASSVFPVEHDLHLDGDGGDLGGGGLIAGAMSSSAAR